MDQQTPLGVDPADLRMALEIGHLASRSESGLLVRLLSRQAADPQGPAPWRPADLDELMQGRSDGTALLRWLKQVRDRAQVLVAFDLHPVFDRLELAALARLTVRQGIDRELEATDGPAARLDERGRLLQVNPGLAALVGRRPTLLQGLHLAELCVGHQDASRLFDGLQITQRSGRWSGPCTVTTACGDPAPVRLELSRRDADAGRVWVRLEDERSQRQRHAANRLQAARDPLTGLASADGMLAQLRAAVRRHRRTGERMALVHLRMDGLDTLQSTLGPQASNVLVHTVGRRLLKALRESDDVAYLGQGDFAAIIEGVGDPLQLAQRLQAVHAVVGQGVRHEAWYAEPRLSAGLALMPDDATDLAELMHATRSAADAAQRAGGGRTHFASGALWARLARREQLVTAARGALERGQVHVVLQPQVDLCTGDVVAVECLARWDAPHLGAVSPRAFVPVFEQAGQGAALGRHVVDQALEAWVALHDAGLGVPRVSVNVSPAHLLDPDLLPALRDAADRAGVGLEHLEVELSAAILDHPELPEALNRLAALRAAGVWVCLDDADPDCGRLSQLPDLPVDRVKLDGAHVAALRSGRPAQRAAVDAMLAYAHHAGLRLTAECVEDADTLRALRKRRCPTGQGYALARPRPLAAILKDGWQVAA